MTDKYVSVPVELIKSLCAEIERNTCAHESTHRGGAIWEICDDCGAKWADDEGGKPEFSWPTCYLEAQALIETPSHVAEVRNMVEPAKLPEFFVQMPSTADQAELMAKAGLKWLEDNAPERLKANDWKEAVINECMISECCLIESDPVQTVKNLMLHAQDCGAEFSRRETRTRVPDNVTRVRNAATGKVVWEKPVSAEPFGYVFEKVGTYTTPLYSQPQTYECIGSDDLIRVKTLLRMLWSKYDAGGISMGRSYEAVVLEAALGLLEDVENEQISDKGDLLNETRSYLSKKMFKKLGLQDQLNQQQQEVGDGC